MTLIFWSLSVMCNYYTQLKTKEVLPHKAVMKPDQLHPAISIQMTHKHRRSHGTVLHPKKNCNILASVCINIENIGLYLNPGMGDEAWNKPSYDWSTSPLAALLGILATSSRTPWLLIESRAVRKAGRFLDGAREAIINQLTLRKHGGGAYSQNRGGGGESTQETSQLRLKSKQTEDVPQLRRRRITVTWRRQWNREGDGAGATPFDENGGGAA
jgi:hypothetical protein